MKNNDKRPTMARKISRKPLALALLPLFVHGQSTTLEEVVVTAQKRIQSTQDVPIAISAFGSEQLENLGSTGLQQLTEHIAGVELFDDRGAGQPTWVIRGVGLADFNANNTPTAAIYYDDFYLFSNALGGIGLFDIDRVEVLKGPQGGLYGRNTSGGAVIAVSRKAEIGGGSNGYVKGAYGRWNQSKVEVGIGADLGDSAAMRFAAVSKKGGGWQDSLATPENDRHGDQGFEAARLQFAVDTSEQSLWQIKLDVGRDDSETTLAQGVASLAADGGRCAPALAGSFSQQGCLTLANVTGVAALGTGLGPLSSEQGTDGKRSTSSPINSLDNSWVGINSRFDWEGESFDFTSITAYLDYDFKQIYDFDASPLRLLEENSSTKLLGWSQEFRFQSQASENLFWQAGLVYSEEKIDERRDATAVDNVLVFPSMSYRAFRQEGESLAVYGQFEYDLNEDWSLNGSLRYTKEDKELKNYRFFESDPLGVDLNGSGDTNPFFWLNNVNADYSLASKLSGNIGVNWHVNEETLAYAKITKGFKSGGFFGGFSFSPEELKAYDEEIVWSYEVGLKSQWLDNTLRVNSAFYYYDYKDVQGFTQQSSAVTNTVITKLGNLGDAKHQGAEVEIDWLPTFAPGLSVSGQLAWLEAEYKNSPTIAADPDGFEYPLNGLQRTSAPTFSTALQISYESSISNELSLKSSLNYSWRDDITPRDSLGSNVDYALAGIESYQLLGARVSLSPEDDQWSVSVSVDNLTNENYLVTRSADDLGSFNSIYGRPRSWSLELQYNW